MMDLAEQCCEHLGRYDGGTEVLILHLGHLPPDEDALQNITLPPVSSTRNSIIGRASIWKDSNQRE